MSPHEFRQIKTFFREALRRPAAERPAYVKQACHGNLELQSKVEEFLWLNDETEGFMETPLPETLGFTLSGGDRDPALPPGTLLRNRFLIQGLLESSRLSLLPCPVSFAPTVGAEVNKLAFNVGMGRDWAGIHYRTDALGGIRLGEDVAISVLQDLVRTFTEDFAGFEFTRYDGTPVRIDRNGVVN